LHRFCFAFALTVSPPRARYNLFEKLRRSSDVAKPTILAVDDDRVVLEMVLQPELSES